jgi:chromosomal replication initiator protein
LALARQVAAEPGRHTPFFLVAEPGLGKTHLVGAIGREVAARHPDWRIVQRTGEQFTLDVLEGIRARRMPAVRETYRGADVLLLDDLGFIEVSPKAQEELLHTFEALHAAGRQMVFAADRPPTALTGLNEALRSRLERSLVAELTPPGPATRLAILESMATRMETKIPASELAFLAERITGSPRRMEGALVRISTYASMLGRPVDAAFVREIASPWLDSDPTDREQVPPALVLAAVCREFGMTQRQLRDRDRSRQRDLARQVAMRLLRERSGLAYGEIGRLLGNRSHSTVVEAVAALERKMAAQSGLRITWSRLQRGVTTITRPEAAAATSPIRNLPTGLPTVNGE